MKTLTRLMFSLVLALPLAANAASAAQRSPTPFTDAELDALLAPIALYPDTVLSHVLIAATVPEDVEAAADWIYRHDDLRGQEAVDAVERFDWDPSVKALVAFPEVLERMDEDPEWTENLGLAFLEQEETVLDRVQYLRDRAHDNGSLDRLEHVRVVREREYIYLQPAVTRVYYVPYYNPTYVYGAWWWPSYPPHCWNWWAGRPAGYYHGSTFWWGVNYHVGPTWYASSFNWRYRHVVVSRPHRHYAPSPGYSGRSSMRREHVARHDSRDWRREDARGTRRGGTPVRRGHERHDEGSTHVPQGGGRGHGRRSATEVHAQLSSRRENRRDESGRGQRYGNSPSHRNDGVHRRDRDDSRRTTGPRGRSDEARVQAEIRGRSEGRRQDQRASEREVWRADRNSQPQPQRSQGSGGSERVVVDQGNGRGERQSERQEPRAQSQGHSESRGTGRGADNGQGRLRSRSER